MGNSPETGGAKEADLAERIEKAINDVGDGKARVVMMAFSGQTGSRLRTESVLGSTGDVLDDNEALMASLRKAIAETPDDAEFVS